MLTLGAGFKSGETMFNAVLDRGVIAGLKMQIRHLLERPPVATKQGSFAVEGPSRLAGPGPGLWAPGGTDEVVGTEASTRLEQSPVRMRRDEDPW